jgi:hypothetical protein
MIAISFAVPLLHQASEEVRSGSGNQFLKCRGFQTVEVAHAQRRLLKNVLRHFERCDRLADQEASIRYNFVQCPSHNGDRRSIKFSEIPTASGHNACPLEQWRLFTQNVSGSLGQTGLSLSVF